MDKFDTLKFLRRRWRPNDTAPAELGKGDYQAYSLVDLFLTIHQNWFTDLNNELYRQKRLAGSFLIEYLATGYRPVLSYDALYAVQKFESEYLPWFTEVTDDGGTRSDAAAGSSSSETDHQTAGSAS